MASISSKNIRNRFRMPLAFGEDIYDISHTKLIRRIYVHKKIIAKVVFKSPSIFFFFFFLDKW